MKVFAFPVSIIVLWICVSSSQTIILVKTCLHACLEFSESEFNMGNL